MRHPSAIVLREAPEDLVRLRQVVQGTLATAHRIGTLDDDGFQEISNQTIEAMSVETLLHVANLALATFTMLQKEAQRRERVAAEG